MSSFIILYHSNFHVNHSSITISPHCMIVPPSVSFSKSPGGRCYTTHKGIRASVLCVFLFLFIWGETDGPGVAYGTIIHRSCLGPEPPSK